MSSRKFFDWRTVNLDEFNNVVFKDALTKGAKTAVIKNNKGEFLQFISPTLRTFGIGEQENDGKLAWSISQSLDADAKDAADYQKFLGRLTVHMGKFCTTGRKPEPLAQFPKMKDPNNPKVFIETSPNVFARDTTRSATVRYKIYTERDNGLETGSLGVKIFGKGNVPLFDYNDADSRAAFKDEPAPDRTWDAEKAAVGPGSRVQVLCTARLTSMSYGAIFYGVLAATQIKRMSAGGDASDRNAPVFAINDEDEVDGGEEEATRMLAPPASKKRPRAEDDDGVDDELEEAARMVAPPASKKRPHTEDDDGVNDEESAAAPPVVVASKKKPAAPAAVEEEEEAAAEEPALAPAPVIVKKRKLVVPAAK